MTEGTEVGADGARPARERWWRLRTARARTRGPLLLLVEGAAGTGKSALITRLLECREFAAAEHHLLDCTPTGLRTREPARGEGKPTRGEGKPARGEGQPGRTEVNRARSEATPPLTEESATGPVRTATRPTGTATRSDETPRPPAGSPLPALASDPPAHPLVLVADDAHLADEESLNALWRWLDRPVREDLTLVLAYRPEELPVPGLPWGRERDYPARLTVLRHRLAPLDEERTADLARTALGPGVCGPGFTARLHARSGGNPQVLVDLLGLCAPADGDTRPRTAEDVDEAGVPARLATLTLRRLAALPGPCRPVVEAAAVLDVPALSGELAAVSRCPDPEAALTAALAAGLLEESGQDGYRFGVPLAARAVREHLPGPVRERLHRAAAEMLGREQPVPWERVAGHRRGARQLRLWLRAVERAARHYGGTGDHLAAISLLERTLAVARVPRQLRDRLAILLAHNALEGPRSDRAVQVLRQIIDDPDLDRGVRGEARLDLGMLLSNQAGQPLEGNTELIRAVEELADRPALASRAMSHLAMPDWPGLSLAENMRWLEGAEEAAERSGDEVARAAVLANRLSALLGTGHPAARALLDRLPREHGLLACRQHAARGLVNAGEDAVGIGDYALATRLLAEGIELSRRTGTPYNVASGRGAQLLRDWMTGHWEDLPERARAFADESEGMPMLSGLPGMALAGLALARGDWAEVERRLYGPHAPAENAAPVTVMAMASALRIRLALARGQREEAAAETAVAWRRLRAKGVWVWAAESAPWALDAVLGTGQREQARSMVEEFAAGLQGRDAPAASAALEWCRGALAEAEGEVAEAVGRFRGAGAAFAALPRPYLAALATERAGTLAAAAGTDRALGELQRAVAELSGLGALWDAARVRAVLRDLQPPEERRPRGRPSYGGRLSPREEEVARFAASGLTNREIALTLHLSPRTVEQHIAHAMRKTGAQTRAGLAALPPEPPDQGAAGERDAPDART
ncbi:LuxR C-terminal-related transcriptional regulator [Streptomyces physcomitrii]|uniref:Helix-turn-helix transcriptional regulator n=1 Tax=Streptomyces physcomitrii TaxID=2724184 RepID=A0ABX1H9U5_9ACTN|nr:LuxR C-terminal-related transcriptional regulator [Streptomyces physcomitrii]NKI45122.1 helix-turn-helix transcriptional regulator [Streptomyces physcomitrii]